MPNKWLSRRQKKLEDRLNSSSLKDVKPREESKNESLQRRKKLGLQLRLVELKE